MNGDQNTVVVVVVSIYDLKRRERTSSHETNLLDYGGKISVCDRTRVERARLHIIPNMTLITFGHMNNIFESNMKILGHMK